MKYYTIFNLIIYFLLSVIIQKIFGWSPRVNSMFFIHKYEQRSMTDSLAAGAQLAFRHCQDRFKWDRWNCPDIAFSRKAQASTNKETAFVRAITAAGVMYNIALNCSRGELEACRCSKTKYDVDIESIDTSELNDLENYLNAKYNVEDINEIIQHKDKLYSNHKIDNMINADQIRLIIRKEIKDYEERKKMSINKDSRVDRTDNYFNNINGENCSTLGFNESDWQWKECNNEYIAFGEKVSREYLDELDQGNDLQSRINLHNYNVGRVAVIETMKKQCRCHGISGSCTIQSCWMQLSPFSEVAIYLRQKYDNATFINFQNDKSVNVNKSTIVDEHKQRRIISVGNSAHVPFSADIWMNITENELVYLEESPDYCIEDNITGWPGTRGRLCSRDKSAPWIERRSCGRICRTCGFRVKKRKHTRSKRCRCAFHWCCYVKCDTCIETVEEFFCD